MIWYNSMWFNPFHRKSIMRESIILAIPLLIIITGCSDNPTKPDEPHAQSKYSDKPVFTVEPLKWFDGHSAAVSITYDTLWGQWKSQRLVDYVVNETLRKKLRIDFEMTTVKYDHPEYEFIVTDIRENVIPRGIHFFGHGHEHVYHDSLTYEEAYESFKLCFDLMTQWGFKPRAYGYPHSSGSKPSTQLANMAAGFICARGAENNPDLYYICPDDKTEPENWYYLPSIQAGQDEPIYINDHSEMEPLLSGALDKKAWVILLYHAIGFPGEYCYYPINEYLKDTDQIASHDFWCGNMDMVACYIKERNRFSIDIIAISSTKESFVYDVIFRDGLDNSIYDQPLSLEITFETDVPVQKVQFEPLIVSQSELLVENNRLKLNVVPDEKKYRMWIFK